MNEKLKQLAKRIPHWRVSENPPNGATVVYDSEPYGCGSHIGLKSLEEFAELIIRECAKKGFDIFDEEPDAPASDLQFYVRDRILQHFGVEE